MLLLLNLGVFCILLISSQTLANNPIPPTAEGCTFAEAEMDNGEFFCGDEDCKDVKRCLGGVIVSSSCQEYADKCVSSPDRKLLAEDPGCKFDFSKAVGEFCSDNDEDDEEETDGVETEGNHEEIEEDTGDDDIATKEDEKS